MKKILCAFLSTAIVLTTLLSIPIISSAKITNTAGIQKKTILDSADIPNGGWLTNNGRGSGTKEWVIDNNENSVKIMENGCSEEILSSADAEITDVEDFTWQFDYRAGSKIWARSAFLFHVDENDATYPSAFTSVNNTITNQSNFDSIFGLGLLGTNNATAGQYKPINCMEPYALTVLYPAGNGVRPLGNVNTTKEQLAEKYGGTFTAAMQQPDEDGRISLKADSELGVSEIDIAKWMTIKMELVDNKLTVEVWQSNLGTPEEKADTYRTKTFVLNRTYALAMQRAAAGDFVLSMGNNNAAFKNMTISTEVAVEKTDGLVFDTSTVYDANSDASWVTTGNTEATFGGSDTPVSCYWDATNGATYMTNYFSSTPILASNGYTNTKNTAMTDFVWEFEYMPVDPRYGNTSFLFHVNDNSALATGSSVSRNSLKNVLGVSFFGANHADTNNDMQRNTIVVGCANESTGYRAASFYTDENSYRKPLSSVAFAEETKKVFYTVRIILKGNALTASIWETDAKDSTYKSVYYEFTDAQMANAMNGDFAIFQGNSSCCVKNMKIYNGTDEFMSDEDYSAYTDKVDKTSYTFETGNDGIERTPSSSGTIFWDEDKKALAFDATNETENWNNITMPLDNGNNNLGDFVLTYDYAQNHNWTNDYVAFRTQDSVNQYRMRVYKGGASITSSNYDYLRIVKIVDGVENIIGEASLSRSLTKYTDEAYTQYTIKLVVTGNRFEVYFAPVGTVYTEPMLIAFDNDNPYTTGTLQYRHFRGLAYLDNINIYDLTAVSLAEDVETLPSPLTRNDRSTVTELVGVYAALNTAQAAKLASYKTVLNTGVSGIAALERTAMNVNGDSNGDVNICDLVRLSNKLADSAVTVAAAADPHYVHQATPVLDDDDFIALRKYLFGEAY